MTRILTYKSWRFVMDAPGEAGVPGLQISPTGGAVMATGPAAVRQAIRILLSTVPGERVMRPEYGCNIHRLLFAPNEDTTAGLAIHYVSQALRRWEPRIDLIAVDATASPDDPARLDITVDYRLKATQEHESFVYTFQLEGANS